MNYQSAFKMLVSNFFGQANFLTVPVALIEYLDGDILAAIHLNRILYWASRSNLKNGVFYKRYGEWKSELYQPVKRLRANVTKFVDMGILSTKVKRVPIRNRDGELTGYGDTAVFYKVNWEQLALSFSAFEKK